MLAAITLLLFYQLVGEVAAHMFGWPVPGPVIGMALLFITLLVRGGPSASVQHTANTILQPLSLLSIPAGTGVIVYAELIREQWLALSSALLVSSLAAIAVTALMLQWLLKKKKAMQSTSSSKAKP